MVVGAIALVVTMVLVVIMVILRFSGRALPGTFDLTQLMVVIPAAFALSYAALQKRHVVINIFVSRFPQRVRAVVEVFTCLVSLATWGIMGWATYQFALKMGLREITEVLRIPYLPFRLLLAVALVLLSVVYLLDLFKALKQALKK
jgi:TRAP-type C4-dicarboxylate transport system permease small subunit